MNAAEKCLDLASTAGYLGFSSQHIFYLAAELNRHYTTIEIPKHSDPRQKRTLDIPSAELKGVQRVILQKILSHISIDDSVYSYVQGRSIISAAQEFCPGRAILNMDIKEFFPSIGFSRVFGLFQSFGFNEKASFLLSRLTTKGNYLAQGAPTSPVLSNLVLANMDSRFNRLAQSWELKYLRYSDDIFFHKEKNFNYLRLSEISTEILERSGFGVNSNKTCYHPKGLPRITLGLLTHGVRPKIPGTQRRKYRSLFFRASRDIHWADANKDRLSGILEWYKSVNGKDDTYLQYKKILQNLSKLRLHDSYKSI